MTKFKDEAHYEQMDKRTKEYKAWKEWVTKKQEKEHKGVGDVVEAVTRATGIKGAVEMFFGEDCGCDGRQDYLNKKLPFARGVVNQVSEEGYFFLKDIFSRERRGKYTREELQHLTNIYNHVYGKREVFGGCSTCRNTGLHKGIAKLEMYFNATTEFMENLDSEE